MIFSIIASNLNIITYFIIPNNKNKRRRRRQQQHLHHRFKQPTQKCYERYSSSSDLVFYQNEYLLCIDTRFFFFFAFFCLFPLFSFRLVSLSNFQNFPENLKRSTLCWSWLKQQHSFSFSSFNFSFVTVNMAATNKFIVERKERTKKNRKLLIAQ